jgi:hypothetical protein
MTQRISRDPVAVHSAARRTTFREQAAVREAFSMTESPDDANAKRKARDAEIGIAQLGGLPSNL